MNYHIGVAHNGRKHITLANIHSSNGLYHANYNSEYYKQNPMSMMHCLSFNATRNIRHAYVVYPCASVAEKVYMLMDNYQC